MGKIKIKKEELEKLVNQKLKDSEIAKILNVKTISIYFARKRYKINRESYSVNQPFILTEKHKEFFLGCLLGDGSMRIDKKTINPRFSCEHSIKQKDYVLYKQELIKELNPFYKELIRKTVDKRNNKLYESCKIRLNANSALLNIYNLFYKPKKVFPISLLDYYTPFAMAIHYMDDGYLSADGYILCTNSFDKESLEIFMKFLLKKYNIKTTLRKRNIIYILKESKETFTNLIKPYFITSMMYKLHNV
jgi:hypothetical protein